MTDVCCTCLTGKGMGSGKKKCQIREMTLCHGDASVAVFNQFEVDSGAARVCEFHRQGAMDGLTTTTSPVCLNEWLQLLT